MDVLDDPRHVRLELLPAHVRFERPHFARLVRRRGGHRARKRSANGLDRRLGTGPSLAAGEVEGDHGELVLQVVECEHHLAHHQRQVGKPERIRIGRAEVLDRAHEVVAEDADRPAGERRQLVAVGKPVAVEQPGDRTVGIVLVGLLDPVALVDGQPALRPADHRVRAEAEERVAAEAPLLGGLEEVRGPGADVRIGAQLQERRDRRLAVVDEPGDDRDDRRGVASDACH